MITTLPKPSAIKSRLESGLPNTSMPDHDWWESLWSRPQKVLQGLGLREKMSVLDLGCGYGHFTIPAAELVYPAPVVGIDIDCSVLAEAQQAGITTPNCLWLNQDLLTLPHTIASKFDYVMMHSTFHGLADPIAFVQDVIKLLNPGGYFSVINWQPIPREETIWMGKPRGPQTEMRLSMQQFQAIVKSASPRFVTIRQITLPPYHYGVTLQLH